MSVSHKVLQYFFIITFLTVTQAPMAMALEPYPLSPSDTSSPRATLHSFLDNMNIAIKGWRENKNAPETDQAFRRAIDTLDFSTTPDSSATTVQIEYSVMLKEVLDRLDLPSYTTIPNTAEVTEKNITRWTIPSTNIRLVRIEDGPRAGDFLFSADTVQNLNQYYNRIKGHPYKNTTTAGCYEDIIGGKHAAYNFEKQARFRLSPVDTSSPRATLEGFLNSVNSAFVTAMKVEQSHSAMTKAEILKAQEAAQDLFERAVATLDLHEVPAEHREDVGIESVLLLKEIIDRLPLPQKDIVPDSAMVTALKAARKQTSDKEFLYHWKYPNTEIEIVEIGKGARQGQFLFSANTVRRLNNFYTQMKDYPYRPDDLVAAFPEAYVSSEKSEGFYKYYISTPGVLIPQAHFLSKLIQDLPDSFKEIYGGQALWQWIALVLCMAIIILVTYIAFQFIWLPAIAKAQPLRNWLCLLVPIVIMATIKVVVYFLSKEINLTGDVLTVVLGSGKLLIIIISAWTAFALCKTIAETIIISPKIPRKSINATLVRLSARVFGVLISAGIVIAGGQRLGIDMLPLLAGLGVGGLAVALAAKQSIANVIGSLILLFNRPVKVGDLCRYGDTEGTVEDIGLISTRIRSLERTVITVPNADFSEMHLENFQLRDQRLLKTTIQLRCETTSDQMRWVLTKLRELLLSHPKVSPDPARVRFTGYGAFSKDILIQAYLYCQDQETFLAIQEDILLRIEDIINESGSDLAFPSQTIYTCRDKGLDTERGQQAEADVREWRSKNQLAFPDFSEKHREELRDSIDYPPKGSQSEKPLSGPSMPLTSSPTHKK